MKTLVEKNYEAMSELTKNILLGYMSNDRRVNMSITGEESWFDPDMGDIKEFVVLSPIGVMRVKHLILVVDGSAKVKMVKTALTGLITEEVPTSILQLHPNLTVVLDEEPASELSL